MSIHTLHSAPEHASRLPRFGAGSRVYRTSDAAGLTDTALRHVAPSVFAGDKHASRSARYTYIPTAEILAGLRKEGFLPMEVRQAGSRIEGKADFTKHMIRLRHAGIAAPVKVGDTIPEIVLVNSHDGTSSYHLMLGMFRLVCSNGLIVSDGTRAAVRVSHTGDARNLVLDGCVEILRAAPESLESVRAFTGVRLSDGEQLAFARAALTLRYPDATPEAPAPVPADRLLHAQRVVDMGNDLWSTFNRVQENSVRGGQQFRTQDSAGRHRRGRTREVKGIDGNVSLNRALWTLAEEMKKLKAV